MKTQEKPMVKITERALYQRINRKLRHEGEQLRTCRSELWQLELGRYYIVDVFSSCVGCQHVDLETLGRELGVMQPWEELEEASE
jgi:hypothetical protein